jgi:hypothetical protein
LRKAHWSEDFSKDSKYSYVDPLHFDFDAQWPNHTTHAFLRAPKEFRLKETLSQHGMEWGSFQE